MSKVIAIARTARRGIQLFTLHLDCSAHPLDTLRITPSLTRTEQDRGDGTDDCEEPRELEGIGSEQSAEDRDHRSPLRRSSIRAQIM